jgi:hypothetical protein
MRVFGVLADVFSRVLYLVLRLYDRLLCDLRDFNTGCQARLYLLKKEIIAGNRLLFCYMFANLKGKDKLDRALHLRPFSLPDPPYALIAV